MDKYTLSLIFCILYCFPFFANDGVFYASGNNLIPIKENAISMQKEILNLNRDGDYMDVQVRDGEIVLKLKKLVDKDQAWFWTKRWQQGEKEAEEDIRDGRVHRFPDAKSAITHLQSQSGKK